MIVARSDAQVNEVFGDDNAANALSEIGFRKVPTVANVSEIKSLLLDYNCIMKVKAAMDQFIEGLKTLCVHYSVVMHPEQMKPFFVYTCRNVCAG